MKRGLLLALCLIFSLLFLCSCGPDENTSSVVESSLPESLPESSELSMSPVEFCAKYAGTWTSESGKFMWFTCEGNKPAGMFAIWNAGGPFPAGPIIMVTKLEENKYEIIMDCPAVPATEMNDAIEAHQLPFVIEDLHNNSLRITAYENTETYVFDANRQYAPLEPDVSEPELPSITPAEFCSKYEGTWTADSGKFMWFTFENNKPAAMFAIWNAGGPFPGGEISNVTVLEEDKYEITMNCPAIPASEMNSAVKAHQELYVIEDLRNNSLRITPQGQSSGIYHFNPQMQYPPAPPPEPSMTPAELCSRYNGTWTSESGKFMWFTFENNKPVAMFAIWYAGGPFPGGEISKVKKLGENKYEMTMDCPAIPETEMNGAVEAHQEFFVIEITSSNSMNITAYGNTESYVFDPQMQYPLPA